VTIDRHPDGVMWRRRDTAQNRRTVQRFIVAVKGLNFDDFEDAELLQLPMEGDTIETRYGTCVVTAAEPLPDNKEYAGKITCRLP
jgi:hypothetical protein